MGALSGQPLRLTRDDPVRPSRSPPSKAETGAALFDARLGAVCATALARVPLASASDADAAADPPLRATRRPRRADGSLCGLGDAGAVRRCHSRAPRRAK